MRDQILTFPITALGVRQRSVAWSKGSARTNSRLLRGGVALWQNRRLLRRMEKAQSKRLSSNGSIRGTPWNSADFTKASPEDLRTYLGLLTAEAETTSILQEWDRNIQGAEESHTQWRSAPRINPRR